MRHEVININNTLMNKSLEMQIAKQCAPLITGIKISNLLITHFSNIKRINEIFEGSTIKIKFIYRQADRITLLLYKPEELLSYLDRAEARRILTVLGYIDQNLNSILKGFAERFAAYMKEKSAFPHEMGILLGYPVADVEGFMEHEGKSFIYSGYWKVYSDLPEALHTFHQYKVAKEKVSQLVAGGLSVKGIMKLYQQELQIQKTDELMIAL